MTSSDPFETSKSTMSAPGAPSATPDFSVREAVGTAWQTLWTTFPLWLGVCFAALLISLLSVVTVVGAFFVIPVVAYGFFRFVLNAVDRDAYFSDLLSGFQVFGRALGGMWVIFLALALINVPGQIMQAVGEFADSFLISAVGLLGGMVFQVAFASRLQMAFYFLVDQDLGGVDSLKASWSATEGQWGSAIQLFVLTIPVVLLGFLALVIGVLPAVFLTYLWWAAAYRQMFPRRAALSESVA